MLFHIIQLFSSSYGLFFLFTITRVGYLGSAIPYLLILFILLWTPFYNVKHISYREFASCAVLGWEAYKRCAVDFKTGLQKFRILTLGMHIRSMFYLIHISKLKSRKAIINIKPQIISVRFIITSLYRRKSNTYVNSFAFIVKGKFM